MTKLFDHYPGKPEAAELAGARARSQEATLDTLEYNLAHQHDQVANHVSGRIDEAVSATADAPRPDAAEIKAAGLVAAGAAFRFAKAIRYYNDCVDNYNEGWEAEVAADFHVAADAGHEKAQSDAQNEAARNEIIADRRAARRQYYMRLKERVCDEHIDDEADATAALLLAGPTRSNILALYINNDISRGAAAAALGLSSVEPLRTIETMVSTANSMTSRLPDALPALAAYFGKLDPKVLAEGPKRGMSQEMYRILNARHADSITQQRALYRAELRWRSNTTIANRGRPGPLFSRWQKQLNKLPAVRVVAKGLGKALPWIGIPSGGYSIYNSFTSDNLSVPDRVDGVVGGAAAIAGSAAALALAAPLMPAVGSTAATAAGLIVIGSTVVGLGSVAYDIGDTVLDLW